MTLALGREDPPVASGTADAHDTHTGHSWTAEVGLLVACGDPDAERVVLDAIGGASVQDGFSFRVVRRCLDAADLLTNLNARSVDAIVLGTDLHGLGADPLGAVVSSGLPLVVLAGAGLGEFQWNVVHSRQRVLAANASAEAVLGALLSVVANGAKSVAGAEQRRIATARFAMVVPPRAHQPVPVRSTLTKRGSLIAVTGATDGVGSSTVAVNVGAVLGRTAATTIFEADVLGPSLAAALALDPARNVYLIAHEQPDKHADRWARALASELQPLDAASPHASVLCGVPRPALRHALDHTFVGSLLDQLRAQADFVLVDIPSGREEGTAAAALHAAVLEHADRVLVVSTPDVVGMRRTALFAQTLTSEARGQARKARLELVLNRHRPRTHPDADEVAEVLGLPVAATIPDDGALFQRALDLQRPAVACGGVGRGSAIRALEDLALRIEAAGQTAGPRQRTGVGRFALSTFWRRK